ncbi:MAG: hypothetical protein ACLP9K_08880 [Nitrososphaerales archaeon]
MKAQAVAVVVVVVLIVAIAGVVFVVTTLLSPAYTTKVSCVDSVVIVYAGSTLSNGGQASETVTSVTSFTTTTNSSATAGHVTAQNLSGYVPLTGEATGQRSCTYVR